MYWTDWRTNTLAKANKWTGNNVTVVQRTNTQPFDLQVYHPSRQPQGESEGRRLTLHPIVVIAHQKQLVCCKSLRGCGLGHEACLSDAGPDAVCQCIESEVGANYSSSLVYRSGHVVVYVRLNLTV